MNGFAIVFEKKDQFQQNQQFEIGSSEDNMFKKKSAWTKSKNPNSKRYKNDLANYLDGRGLKCVTERVEGIEEVIGHKGSIIRKDDELIVYASQEIIMRTKVEYLSAWELLSLEGVVITAIDLEHGNAERSIIAYYSYWRELED